MKFRALIGFLILLVSTPSMAQAVTQKELDRFIPSGYRIVKWVEADLDGDKDKDVVIAVEAKNIRYGDLNNPPAKIIVLFRKGKSLQKIWEFSEEFWYTVGRGANKPAQGWPLGEPTFQLKDINTDKNLELIFTLGSFFGAGNGAMKTFIFGYRNGKFENLVNGSLEHDIDGGLVIRDHRILIYSAIVDRNEASYSPHKYQAGIYTWDSRTQRFYCTKKIQTKQKGKAGLRELGLAR
jgi:hypothetical protein